jgi:hypothetical protein
MPSVSTAAGGNNTASNGESESDDTDLNAADAPDDFELPAVTNAEPGAWVVSDDVMVSGEKDAYPITVTGGEYQIYALPYTSSPGEIIPGDATRVRLRASRKSGETVTATLRIGSLARQFSVTTR